MADFTKISQALIKGDAKTVKELTEQAVAKVLLLA